MDVYNKIKQLAKENKVSLKRVAEDTGISINTFKNWNKSDASVSGLLTIAQYFDVSVDYLIGNTTDPHSHKPARVVEALEDIQAYVQQKIDPLKGGQSK